MISFGIFNGFLFGIEHTNLEHTQLDNTEWFREWEISIYIGPFWFSFAHLT